MTAASFSMMQRAGPALSLNFTGGSLPSGVTLTRASTGIYTNSSGILASAAIDTARFDYLVNGAYAAGTPALLIEPAATNRILRSQELDNVGWVKEGSTISANAVSAPDGTATADKIVENSATSAHQVYQIVSAFNGAQVTASVWVKAAGRNYGFLGIAPNGGGTTYVIIVNLTTGALVSATNTGGVGSPGYLIETWPDGWYRLSVYGNHTDGNIATIFYGASNGSSTNYLGNGTDGVYAWGAQVEIGTRATSYILTTSATVTRSADAGALTVPAGISSLRYTFDDVSTQDVSVSSGAYNIPTNLDRARIRTIVGS